MNPEKRNTLTIILFTVYILLLIGIIMFKLPFYSSTFIDTRVINLIPFQDVFNSGKISISRDIIENILIFIPLGIYFCMLKNEWALGKKILSILGLSALFEVFQFVFALGRTDITDVIVNTIGGIIGIGIYALLRTVFKERTAKVINMIALAVTVIVLFRFSQLFYMSHFVMRRLHP